MQSISGYTRRLTNAVIMIAKRRRRWASIMPALVYSPVFAVMVIQFPITRYDDITLVTRVKFSMLDQRSRHRLNVFSQ